MPFEVTTAVKKMLKMTARKKVVQGSTSSGKTYGIIPILYDRALAKNRIKITVTAETLSSLKDGCVSILMDFLQDEWRWNDKCWNGTDFIYTIPSTKSKIQFKTFDSVGKAKAAGKRDILFINEANHVEYEIADALMIRSKEIWLDFNADRSFWAHTEVLTEPNSEFLRLTFEDNEQCPPEILEDLYIKRDKAFYNPLLTGEALFEESNIKSKYWANWWKVYGLGLMGQLVGSIFENWEQIEEVHKEARLICCGVDFGFSVSKFASLNVYKWNGHYVLDELVYANNLDNPGAAKEMKDSGYVSGTVTYCDYAEPKSIHELSSSGIRAVPCESKNDIKTFAIKKLNEKVFFVTKRSVNLIMELEDYIWDEKTGKPKKSDKDHLMDALLYAVGSEGKFDGRYFAS